MERASEHPDVRTSWHPDVQRPGDRMFILNLSQPASVPTLGEVVSNSEVWQSTRQNEMR